MSRLLPCLGKWGAASLTLEDIHGQNFLPSHPSTHWWILLHLQRHPEHPALTVLCDKILFVFLGYVKVQNHLMPSDVWSHRSPGLLFSRRQPFLLLKLHPTSLSLWAKYDAMSWPLTKGGYFWNDLQMFKDRQLLQAAGQLSAWGLWTASIIGNSSWFQRHEEMRSNELGLLLSQRFSTCGSINLGGEKMSLCHEDGNKPSQYY